MATRNHGAKGPFLSLAKPAGTENAGVCWHSWRYRLSLTLTLWGQGKSPCLAPVFVTHFFFHLILRRTLWLRDHYPNLQMGTLETLKAHLSSLGSHSQWASNLRSSQKPGHSKMHSSSSSTDLHETCFTQFLTWLRKDAGGQTPEGNVFGKGTLAERGASKGIQHNYVPSKLPNSITHR